MDEVSASPESPAERFTEWGARLFDPAGRHAKPEALRGIRVLDLSVIIFGPATADFLGELGAEVIKVEMPGQGDVTRILGHGGCWWKGVSVAFFPQNHGKYHVGIDMHHAEGQALIRQRIFTRRCRPTHRSITSPTLARCPSLSQNCARNARSTAGLE